VVAEYYTNNAKDGGKDIISVEKAAAIPTTDAIYSEYAGAHDSYNEVKYGYTSVTLNGSYIEALEEDKSITGKVQANVNVGEADYGVSFDIKPKETVAIVGENGSGKSTLIKLITGYYKPSEGEVKLNGNDTRDTSFPSVAKRLSAVFQRYPHYAMTLRENLAIGDISKEPTDEALRKACAMSGFSPEEKWLPNGFDTMLSREFDDGVGLSGGQIQRIAIARAFYRNSSIIILDEPTAAIDPIEEARIYGRFAELSKDRTSFIVTHRLASVKIADRIIMMKEGKAVEMGTHDELMALDGEYKRMYDSQRQWYESNENASTDIEAEAVN